MNLSLADFTMLNFIVTFCMCVCVCISFYDKKLSNNMLLLLYYYFREISISMNNLFPDSENRYRIFIEGEAGSGKTTLLDKLAYDWSRKSQTKIKNLPDFKFVFLVKLSQLSSDDDISSYCIRHYFQNSYMTENLFEYITKKCKVLFIFDGLDELCKGHKEFNDLLKGRKYITCSFLVTSRFRSANVKTLDTQYIINGLTNADIKGFLSKRDCPYPQENHPMKPLLKVPIFLWFYALLHDDTYFKELASNPHKYSVLSRSELYSLIMDALQRKCHKRMTNMCIGNKEKKNLKKAIYGLSEKAYVCLCENTLWYRKAIYENKTTRKRKNPKNVPQLSIEEFRETALGLVNKRKQQHNLKPETIYVFSHKSLMEWLAAKYVCTKLKHIYKLLSKVNEIADESGLQSSLFLKFVFGYAKDSVVVKGLFDKYIMSSAKTSLYGLECVAECGGYKGIEQWLPFIKEVELDMTCNTLYAQLGLKVIRSCIEYKLETLKIKCDHSDLQGDKALLEYLVGIFQNRRLEVRGTERRKDAM